jgi:hypothetical protein
MTAAFSSRSPFVRSVALAVSLLVTVSAQAVDIQPVYDANITAEQRAVIEAKIALWEQRLPHQNPEHVVTISFANADLGTDFYIPSPLSEVLWADDDGLRGDDRATLAETDSFTYDADGRPTGARIRINSNAAIPWYNGTDPNVPANKYDLWTVMNHEIMHALGFTVQCPRFGRNVTPTDPNDPNGPRKYEGEGGTTTPLTPKGTGTHTDPNSDPNGLMNPTVPKGVRRTPKQSDIDILLDDVWKYPNITGTLSNFDVWNRTGLIANDFQVTLGGIISESITDIWRWSPFGPGQAMPTTNGTVVKWGPGGGQVNPGDKAHFGFKITGDLTPLSYKFEWTQNNVVIGTVPVNGSTWRALTGGHGDGGGVTAVRNRVTNPGPTTVWVFRRVNYSPAPITLADLMIGSPLEVTAFPIDAGPFPLPANGSTYVDLVAPPGMVAIMMIVDYFADAGGAPGAPLGTWLDATELPTASYGLGDLDCDGDTDFDDINPFVLALTDPVTYSLLYPDCDVMLADCNGDGVVDFGDINAFVALLGA